METEITKWDSISITRALIWSRQNCNRTKSAKNRRAYLIIKRLNSSWSKPFRTKNYNEGSKMSHMPTFRSNKPFWSNRNTIQESSYIKITFQTIMFKTNSTIQSKSSSFWWLRNINTLQKIIWCYWSSQIKLYHRKGLSTSIPNKLLTSWTIAITCTRTQTSSLKKGQ